MCGIAGILYKDREARVDESLLTAMRDSMVLRGPDDAGIYVDGHLGLAHRRLSIVGLSTGHQPMCDGDENLWIVFNGEIYNYLEQKSALQKLGYGFRTESDTEVIINLYAEYGDKCVDHLNGMFAFAIWDRRKQQLFLARDRLGIKPLYYAETENAFVFASEIKALLKFPELRAAINPDAVYEYFVYRAVSGEQTLFDGVRSLLPGYSMRVGSQITDMTQYWQHSARPIDYRITAGEAVERLTALLEDAVKVRLMAEVPLGTFCSGGIDSSLVTAIAATLVDEPINTFSVGFHEAGFDETVYARQVSQKYATLHHELRLDSNEFSALLPELVQMNDEPLNFSNSVHIYAISKLAREHVTVVLTGEGADELFFGYPRYQIPRIASALKRVSLLVQPLLGAASLFSSDHRLEKLGYYLRGDLADIARLNSSVNRTESVDRLLDGRVEQSLAYRRAIGAEMAGSENLLAHMSLQDQKTYLVSILNRQDKMSMGASVEARVPFLDYRLVEFANSLPAATRISGFKTKMLVKKTAARYLPDNVIHRRKSGFGVPMASWYRDRDGLGGQARELFDSAPADEYLDRKMLDTMFDEHQSGTADHAEILWTAHNFLLWRQAYSL